MDVLSQNSRNKEKGRKQKLSENEKEIELLGKTFLPKNNTYTRYFLKNIQKVKVDYLVYHNIHLLLQEKRMFFWSPPDCHQLVSVV